MTLAPGDKIIAIPTKTGPVLVTAGTIAPGDKVISIHTPAGPVLIKPGVLTPGEKVVSIQTKTGRVLVPVLGGIIDDTARFNCASYVTGPTSHGIGNYLISINCMPWWGPVFMIALGRDNYTTYSVSGTVKFFCNPIKKARYVTYSAWDHHMARMDNYAGVGSGISVKFWGKSLATGLPVYRTGNTYSLDEVYPPQGTTTLDLGQICDNITLEFFVASHIYYPSYYPDPNILNTIAMVEGITFSQA